MCVYIYVMQPFDLHSLTGELTVQWSQCAHPSQSWYLAVGTDRY